MGPDGGRVGDRAVAHTATTPALTSVSALLLNRTRHARGCPREPDTGSGKLSSKSSVELTALE